MEDLFYPFGGSTYSVQVDYPRYLSGQLLSAEGRNYVEGVIERIPAALDLAASKLLEIYNEVWLDEDHKELDALQFKSALQLEGIDLLEPNRATLYFTDGDMFGGHYIEVVFKNFEPVHAGLIG